jgi:hypothetical protein
MKEKRNPKNPLELAGPFQRVFATPASSKIIDFLVTYQEYDYSESDIARNTNLNFKTVSKVLKMLLSEGIVEHTGNSGQSKMYRIHDCNNPRTRGIHKFYKDIIITSNTLSSNFLQSQTFFYFIFSMLISGNTSYL